MNSFNKIIESLSSLYPEDRGTIFEFYCKWFLENDPCYSLQLRKVWLWKDWPGKWGRDKGIDLIAETHRGEFWAIQAKAYNENYYITKEDVDTFLSESARGQISYRLLISTTNRIGNNAREVIDAQEKQVGLCTLDYLEASPIIWPLSIDELVSSPRRTQKTPYPHQETAINDILDGFEESNCGQLHMACGTGKTLVGLWLWERLKCQNSLVLVPSISLVSQLYREWAANANINFDPIFVCSDSTVNESDQMIINLSELGFPATTSPDDVIKYISSGSSPKIVFCTYHSSPVIVQACNAHPSLNFDLTIADEAHRCAGPANSDFATIVKKIGIRTQRKIFMTATPRIFSENVKYKSKKFEYEIASMDDTNLFGPVFHELSFSEAIAQQLLSDYQVVISVMNDKTYQEYADRGRFVIFNNHETDARTVASQLLISKSIKQHNLKRVISFHSRKKTALEFIETFSNIQPLLPENEKPDLDFLNAIFGEMPQAKRHNILKLFDTLKEGKSGLLANVRCLAEGVDVPAIDGIAFIDPKGSEIDIVQAVGRAIRKAPDKTLGTVIIPLFVDVDEDGTISLEQSCFQTVWKVLQDLRAHDDILAESIDNLRLELGRRGFKSPPKLNKITIDLPAGIGVEFSNALRIKIVERCSSSWMFYFGLLENFIEKYSHSNIPITYLDNPSLAKWVGKQRVRYKEGKLAKERVEKLERVGFIWDPFVAVWEEMFVALSGFKIKEGHCNVPHSQNQQLGSWSSRQRNLHKKGLLSIERIGRLEKLGFQWDLDNARWEEMYVVLCNFNKANLHCNVPQNYKDNPMLASWVNTQRNNYKKGLLSTERVTGLNQIGVEWDPLDTTWEKMYVALCKFQEVNGHTNVPSTDKNKKLASWVVVQRVRYKKGRLSEERIKKLEQLNFIWDPLNTEREKMIATLRAFKEMHGHCNVPQRYLKNQKLGSWVATQRASHNKGKLPTELVSLLEELGLIWDPFEAAWEEKFLALCEFKQLNGHCRVPKEYNENPPLGAWVSKQRKLFNKGKLSIERSQRLEAMGVIWEPQSKKS